MNDRFTDYSELAPIVIFVYNRPDKTKRLVESLLDNQEAKESHLIVYSDGPKRDFDIPTVKAQREYIHSIEGFKSVKIIESSLNRGLSASIVKGVTEVINQFGTIIVLEDDLIVSPFFLKYMNQSLRTYANDDRVFGISGYSFIPSNFQKMVSHFGETHFLKITSSWAWGTWQNRWMQYDELAIGWEELKHNSLLRINFNFGGSYDYYNMMQQQMESKKIDSWAIRWYWTIFKQGGLTLYPTRQLCINDGFDGSGTHCGENTKETFHLTYNVVNGERIGIKETFLFRIIVMISLWIRSLV